MGMGTLEGIPSEGSAVNEGTEAGVKGNSLEPDQNQSHFHTGPRV